MEARIQRSVLIFISKKLWLADTFQQTKGTTQSMAGSSKPATTGTASLPTRYGPKESTTPRSPFSRCGRSHNARLTHQPVLVIRTYQVDDKIAFANNTVHRRVQGRPPGGRHPQNGHAGGDGRQTGRQGPGTELGATQGARGARTRGCGHQGSTGDGGAEELGADITTRGRNRRVGPSGRFGAQYSSSRVDGKLEERREREQAREVEELLGLPILQLQRSLLHWLFAVANEYDEEYERLK